MKIAIVGVTGVVGQEMLKILEESNIKITELIPIASKKSEGKNIKFKNKFHKIQTVENGLKMNPKIALFSAGSLLSKDIANKFIEKKCYVIDNSSAWRMDENTKLIVPEINGDSLLKTDRLIANPNCSTIQLVMVLAPLHKKFKIKRVIVSTYQAVSGSGKKAVDQLNNERQKIKTEKKYNYQIDLSFIPLANDST